MDKIPVMPGSGYFLHYYPEIVSVEIFYNKARGDSFMASNSEPAFCADVRVHRTHIQGVKVAYYGVISLMLF